MDTLELNTQQYLTIRTDEALEAGQSYSFNFERKWDCETFQVSLEAVSICGCDATFLIDVQCDGSGDVILACGDYDLTVQDLSSNQVYQGRLRATQVENLGEVVILAAAPTATNIVLSVTSGGLYEGGQLGLTYSYQDINNSPEGATVLGVWGYPTETDANNDTNGTQLSATSSYLIGAGEVGGYFRGFVTPVATEAPTTGSRSGSNVLGPVIEAPAAPVASDVLLTNISGGLFDGGVLELTYTFSDINNSPEGLTALLIKRYPTSLDATNDTSGTTVSTSAQYTLQEADETFFFRGFVTPISTEAPTTGVQVGSNTLGPVLDTPEAPEAQNVTLTNTSGGLDTGGVLDLTYTFFDTNNSPEGLTVLSIKSYPTETDANNDTNGTEVSATSQYTIQAADDTLYFRGFVTPVATEAPTTGAQVGSNVLGPVVVTASTSVVIQLREPTPRQWIVIPDYTIGVNEAFTIEALFKIDPATTINGNDGLFQIQGVNYGINFFGSNPRLFLGSDLIVSSQSITNDVWYHIALTRDTLGNTNMYLDGVNVGSATGWTDGLTIDHLGRGADRSTDGQFDNFRIWSVERTPVEINDNQLLDITSAANLERVYNFENAVAGGTVIPDESGNGQDAAINTDVIVLDTRVI